MLKVLDLKLILKANGLPNHNLNKCVFHLSYNFVQCYVVILIEKLSTLQLKFDENNTLIICLNIMPMYVIVCP